MDQHIKFFSHFTAAFLQYISVLTSEKSLLFPVCAAASSSHYRIAPPIQVYWSYGHLSTQLSFHPTSRFFIPLPQAKGLTVDPRFLCDHLFWSTREMHFLDWLSLERVQCGFTIVYGSKKVIFVSRYKLFFLYF